MRSPHCSVCRHLDIEEIDRRLIAGEKPLVVAEWLRARRPGDALNKYVIGKHRKWHLQPERVQPPPPPEPPPAPPPAPTVRRSAKYDRITEDIVEQETLRTFIDSLDTIPADKIADYMIEREKAKQRAPAVKGKGGEPPDEGDPIARLRRSIGAAAGARPTRTGVRMRAVKGGRA